MGDYQAPAKAQHHRPNVLQLKLIGQSHPTGLTNNLLKLFAPRPPLDFKPPIPKRRCPNLTGIAPFVTHFANPSDPEYSPPVNEPELRSQKRARIHRLSLTKGPEKAAEALKTYDPDNDTNVSGDPYKTLFVARLSYETSETRVKSEFEAYGVVKRVCMVNDKLTKRPRGYAFVEYVRTRDMKSAYKLADGMKVDNVRVLVDVERGRTDPNWRPRRLGGGLGTTRAGGEEVDRKNFGTGRELRQSGQPRSEEPRVREDRHVERDRERFNDRGRERGKSHERSSDRLKDRDHREDRHDRDENSETNRGGRDLKRTRGHGRDRESEHGRDSPRDRERGKDKDRDYGLEGKHSRERESGYDRVESRHERHHDREQDQDHTEGEYEHDHDTYDGYDHLGRTNNDNNMDVQGDQNRYDHANYDHDQYNQIDETSGLYERKRDNTRDT